MAAEETLADFASEANFHLINFSRRLAVPEITEPQQERIADYLTALGEKHPEHLELIDGRRGFVAAQFPPKSPDQVPVFSRRVDLFFAAPDLYADGGAFEDTQVDELLARLRTILSVPEVTDRFGKEADDHLWNFTRFLRGGLVAPEQVARILSYLDEVAEEHPGREPSPSRPGFRSGHAQRWVSRSETTTSSASGAANWAWNTSGCTLLKSDQRKKATASGTTSGSRKGGSSSWWTPPLCRIMESPRFQRRRNHVETTDERDATRSGPVGVRAECAAPGRTGSDRAARGGSAHQGQFRRTVPRGVASG